MPATLNLKEKRESRNTLLVQARDIHKKAGTEKRALNAEELTQFDTIMGQFDSLGLEIRTEEGQVESARRLEAGEAELRLSTGRKGELETPSRPGDNPSAEDRKKSPVEIEVRGRKFHIKPGSEEHRRCQPEYRDAFRSYLAFGYENRSAWQTDLDIKGGYITAPEQFVAELIKNVDDEVFMRGLARKFTTLAQSIGAPTRKTKASTFVWGGELTAPTQDAAYKFGKRSLTPHYMTGEIAVSRDLLRSNVMDAGSIVLDELTRDSGELEEQAFMTGDGQGKPLGIFTASADGISTSRDYSTGNATNGPTFDGLIEAKYALKQKYRKRAQWLFHRDAVKKLALLKDTTNQYIWQPSKREGEPDRLLGLPFIESEWVPNTFTTGLYVGMLADFTNYWIVDSLVLEIQKLIELAARNNQDVFLARRKVDGGPMLEEAFSRVKLA